MPIRPNVKAFTTYYAALKTPFLKNQYLVLNSDGEMVSPIVAQNNPIMVASANWAATGWMVAKHVKDAVVVDVGSTSTSIIPIINGAVAAKGKTDLNKLICGELIYTGSLRTNIASIVHSIPQKSGVCKVSSELFRYIRRRPFNPRSHQPLRLYC